MPQHQLTLWPGFWASFSSWVRPCFLDTSGLYSLKARRHSWGRGGPVPRHGGEGAEWGGVATAAGRPRVWAGRPPWAPGQWLAQPSPSKLSKAEALFGVGFPPLWWVQRSPCEGKCSTELLQQTPNAKGGCGNSDHHGPKGLQTVLKIWGSFYLGWWKFPLAPMAGWLAWASMDRILLDPKENLPTLRACRYQNRLWRWQNRLWRSLKIESLLFTL